MIGIFSLESIDPVEGTVVGATAPAWWDAFTFAEKINL